MWTARIPVLGGQCRNSDIQMTAISEELWFCASGERILCFSQCKDDPNLVMNSLVKLRWRLQSEDPHAKQEVAGPGGSRIPGWGLTERPVFVGTVKAI